jgi:hypothetical protein
MADVVVEVVNNTGAVVRLTLDEHGETLAYLRTQVKREDLESVRIVPAARKPSASK